MRDSYATGRQIPPQGNSREDHLPTMKERWSQNRTFDYAHSSILYIYNVG